MKKFLFVLLMLACVALAVVFVFLQKLDGIVLTQIEKIGTRTLGQEVAVEGVNIELKNTTGQITGLTIANPEGFADTYAFSMDRIRLGIDLASVSENPLVLSEFVLEAPVVSLEIKEDGSSNLDQIIAHLQTQEESEPEQPAEPEAEETEAIDAENIRLSVNHLKIAGVQLTLRHTKFGEEPKELVLPDIDVKNVGGEAGLTAAGFSLVVVEEIAKSGAKAALKAEAEKQAGRLLDKAGSALREKLSEAP